MRRVRTHRRIAEAMEDLCETHLEPHLARIAYHFMEAAQAGDVDKAVEYAARPGARADSLLAYEEAARHYEVAIQALQH
jgi:predicted ATPase